MSQETHEANRRSWNAATVAHNSHKRDQARFLREGGSTLFPEELDLLGDISGRTLAHLQCNAGQDSLCLARLGATVTGIDISDEAINFAQQLSRDAEIPATFIRADVYDWLDEAHKRGEQFDIVFCSYGTICWLSDLPRWGRGIGRILREGGRFVIVDFHPASMMFAERFELKYSYFGEDNPMKWDEGVGDYVGVSGGALSPSGHEEGVKDFVNPHPVYEYQWPLSTIFTALIEAGLRIDRFEEYPYSNGAKLFEDMPEAEGGRMVMPEGKPSVPLMYGIAAWKDR
jgi:SAM-dependent methyltransferase